MKIISNITLGLVTASILFVGCSNDTAPAKKEIVKPMISEESLGLRKVSLYDEGNEVAPRKTSYSTDYAGGSKKIDRAFQDAPPMIPHDTTGLLPIKINDNQCLGCHLPDVAPSVGATPIPPSHFTNFRPVTAIAKDGELEKNGQIIKNTSSEKLAHISIQKEIKLVGARFNCSQCHAPQSDTPLAVKNTFKPEYLDADGAHKSRWNGDRMLEGLNTQKSAK